MIQERLNTAVMMDLGPSDLASPLNHLTTDVAQSKKKKASFFLLGFWAFQYSELFHSLQAKLICA